LTYLWTPANFYTATYAWSPTAGLNNPNISNPIATPTSTTDYTVTMSYGNSCTASSTVNVNVVVCTGIDEFGNSSNLEIYPNPTNASINIIGTQNKFIEISNVNGSVMMQIKSSNKNEMIDLSGFATGVYFVKVSDAKTVSIKKVVKY
jgi:hypothetical protein